MGKQSPYVMDQLTQQEEIVSQLLKIVAHTNQKLSALEEKVEELEMRLKL